MRFYLAGGMRGERDWQNEVSDRLVYSGHEFFDPREHGLTDSYHYTKWDLGAVATADGVIAFMAKDNPSGIGLALEVGMAIGMGKPVWFANELAEERKWELVNQATSYCFTSLDALMEAIERQNLPGWKT